MQLGIEFDDFNICVDSSDLFLESDKPVLVVGCSDAKLQLDGYHQAGELYLGDMFKYLRAHAISNRFNVFIMSAKYGLLHMSEWVKTYDMRITEVTPEHYEAFHGRGLRDRLAKASAGQPIFVFLPKAYRAVFEFCFNPENKKALDIMRKSSGIYVSYHHRGSGELKERLGLALDLVRKRESPIAVYRSGCASNKEEIRGYSRAAQSIGTSLWHLRGKPEVLRSVMLASLGRSTFVDNGMLQAIHKGEAFDLDSLLNGYVSLVEKMNEIEAEDEELSELIHSEEQYLSNLVFVIPDDPLDCDAQMEFIEKRSQTIQFLANRGVQWIVPMHKRREQPEDLNKRVKQIYALFDNPEWLIVGIPTLSTPERDFALSTSEIEMMLGVKVNGQRLVKKVHFLGQGDTNPEVRAKNRLRLAQLYGVEISMDSQRTRATFQKDRIKKATKSIVLKAELDRLDGYIEQLKQSEMDEPVIYEQVREYLRATGVAQFCQRWNFYSDNRFYELSEPSGEGEDELDEWLEDTLLMQPDAGYVRVWVAMNVERYLAECGLKPMKGNQRREPVLAHEFGAASSRIQKTLSSELVQYM